MKMGRLRRGRPIFESRLAWTDFQAIGIDRWLGNRGKPALEAEADAYYARVAAAKIIFIFGPLIFGRDIGARRYRIF